MGNKGKVTEIAGARLLQTARQCLCQSWKCLLCQCNLANSSWRRKCV